MSTGLKASCAALFALALTALTGLAQDVPMGALYGHVTDQNGNPVSGATIVVADVPDAAATTGDDGGYGIALPAGDHGIAVISPVVSDQVLVSVPADDAAFADIGLFIPPPAPPDI